MEFFKPNKKIIIHLLAIIFLIGLLILGIFVATNYLEEKKLEDMKEGIYFAAYAQTTEGIYLYINSTGEIASVNLDSILNPALK